MPRKFIKRFLPDSDTLRRHEHLRHFGTLLHNPSLWRINRRSVAGATAVGLFSAFLPLPFQMVIAAAIAILVGVNLPLSVVLVWITNPLTMGPIYYFNYRVGAALLGITPKPHALAEPVHDLLLSMLGAWKPLLMGSLLIGVLLAIGGWMVVRLLWRWHVVSKRWPNR